MDKLKYENLAGEGQDYYQRGKKEEALSLWMDCMKMCYNEKVEKNILKVTKLIRNKEQNGQNVSDVLAVLKDKNQLYSESIEDLKLLRNRLHPDKNKFYLAGDAFMTANEVQQDRKSRVKKGRANSPLHKSQYENKHTDDNTSSSSQQSNPNQAKNNNNKDDSNYDQNNIKNNKDPKDQDLNSKANFGQQINKNNGRKYYYHQYADNVNNSPNINLNNKSANVKNNAKTRSHTSRYESNKDDFDFYSHSQPTFNTQNDATNTNSTPFKDELNNKRYKKQVEEAQSKPNDGKSFESKQQDFSAVNFAEEMSSPGNNVYRNVNVNSIYTPVLNKKVHEGLQQNNNENLMKTPKSKKDNLLNSNSTTNVNQNSVSKSNQNSMNKSPNFKIKTPDPSTKMKSPRPRHHINNNCSTSNLNINNDNNNINNDNDQNVMNSHDSYSKNNTPLANEQLGSPETPKSSREYKNKLLKKVNSNQKVKSQYASNQNSNITKIKENKPEYKKQASQNDSINASRTFQTDNKNNINSSTSYNNINESNNNMNSYNVNVNKQNINVNNSQSNAKISEKQKLDEENRILRENYAKLSLSIEDKNNQILEMNSIIESKNNDLEMKDNYIVRLKLQLDDLVGVFKGIKKDIQ